MNCKSRPSVLTKVFRDIVRNPLRADEDKYLGIFLTHLIQMLDQLAALLEVAADLNELLDVVVRRQFHGSDVDLNEILQEILEQTMNEHTPHRLCGKMGRLTLASF